VEGVISSNGCTDRSGKLEWWLKDDQRGTVDRELDEQRGEKHREIRLVWRMSSICSWWSSELKVL